jgi:hypothetical protein
MAGRSAHSEKTFASDVKYLAAHKMDDAVADELHLAAIPFAHGKVAEQFVIGVVAGDKQRGERFAAELVKLAFLPIRVVPDAKVAADNHIIVFYKNGKVVKEGVGISFYYYAPTTSIVMAPMASSDCPFMFEEVTADFQTVSIQGQVTLKTNAAKSAKRRLTPSSQWADICLF